MYLLSFHFLRIRWIILWKLSRIKWEGRATVSLLVLQYLPLIIIKWINIEQIFFQISVIICGIFRKLRVLAVNTFCSPCGWRYCCYTWVSFEVLPNASSSFQWRQNAVSVITLILPWFIQSIQHNSWNSLPAI